MMEIERTFSVAEIDRVDIKIALGDVTLAAGDGDLVGLRARLRSTDESELESIISGRGLVIKNRTDNGWLMRNGSRIDLVLTVPRDAAVAVTAATGLGDVNAEDVAGLAEILTGKGDVRATGGASPLAVKTGKGDLVVRQWRGDLDVTTGKGDVTISDLAGGLQMTTGAGDTTVERWRAGSDAAHRFKTGSGDMTLREVEAQELEMIAGRGDCTLQQAAVRSLRAQTGFGNFSVEGDPLGGQWEVRTGKGDLALTLPAGAAARVEAATRHGNVRSDLPQVKVARPGPANPLGGRTIVVMGDEPRAEIRLETTKGDISVHTAGAALMALRQQPAGRETTLAPVERAAASAQPALAVHQSPGKSTAVTILESLARGEITVDEAEALLQSLP